MKLQFDSKNIRNVCILAHVDHGKTSLADSLIASNGIFSQKMVGKLRYMDSRKDEQVRGITMKSSAISLQHIIGEKKYLINLIDSPGHVDFSGEVSTAVRLCDGAIIVVDVVEGVCPQTIVALRQAWSENMKPVLVLNKIDRLVLEIKLTPLDAFIHIQQVLEQVNAVVGEVFTAGVMEKTAKSNVTQEYKNKDQIYLDWNSGLEEVDDSTVFFDPDQGNVIFASAYDGWGFSVADFARMYCDKLGVNELILRRALWGDFYLNSKTKEVKKGAQSKSKKPLFVQLILENLWAVYEAIVIRRDKAMTEKIIKTLGLKILPRDLKHSDPKVQLQAVCGQWLPLATVTLDMVCNLIPSPCDLSEERVESLFCTALQSYEALPSETKELKKYFLECSSSDNVPIIVCVSKMFPVEEKYLPENKQRPLTVEEIQKRRELAKQKQLDRNLETKDCKGKTNSFVESESVLHGQDDSVEENVFIAFARVFSGTLKKGQKLYVLGPKHNPAKALENNFHVEEGITLKDLKNDEHVTMATIGSLYLLMGRGLEELESVSAGNVIGIGGLEEHILKSATLSTSLACPPFVDLNRLNVPILRVALEPKQPSEMPALVKGLKLLNQADPCVQVMVQETGEHVLVTAGGLHLERCLDDLKERYAKIEINVSEPIVPFRETVIIPPKIDMVNEVIDDKNYVSKTSKVKEDGEKLPMGSVETQTPDKRSTIRIRATPLPQPVVDLLDKNSDVLKVLSKRRNLKSVTEFESSLRDCFSSLEDSEWHESFKQIWSFGPRYCGPNILLNRSENPRSLWNSDEITASPSNSDYDSSFISGFQLATLAGPMCEEPMMGVCFIVERWDTIDTVEEESSTEGMPYGPVAGQIMSTVKELCRKSFQAQPQRLMAAMYSCNIQVTAEALGKMYAVLGRRHGRVLSGDMQEGSQRFSVTAVLPVVESFDFAEEIRKQTSGHASPQLLFSHWEVVDIDPFWVPSTEEEYLHFGEKADSDNRALKYTNAVRRRKGLAVDVKIVEHAEKQRTLTRNK